MLLKKTYFSLFCLFLFLLFFSLNVFSDNPVAAVASSTAEVMPWQSTEKLTGAHDPTVIRDDRGIYTLLTTNNLLELRQSTDMVNWTTAGKILNAVPAWMNTSLNTKVENIWAPQIVFRNGRYWVYYCGSSFGTNNSAIGVASSPTLNTSASNYGWTDHGEVIKTTTANNYNAIDPELLTDKNGYLWLSFGSFWTGIKMIAMDPSTGKRLSSNTTVYSIAGRGGGAIEGPSTIEHNGYYFLFTSWDNCCAGLNSTYRTMVGRSTSPSGNYVDKQNRSLTNNFSEELLKSYGRYIGPGGGAPFKDGRRDYYALHYYNGNQNGSPTLQIREIVWDDANWPILAQPFLGRRLSYEAEHAMLTNSTIATGTNASNKEYVNAISAADSKVRFYINAFAAGEYTIRIHYAAAANASQFLKVNNGTTLEVLYPLTATIGQFPAGQAVSVKVILKEGGNTLEFTKGTSTVELDRVDVIRNVFEKLEGGAKDNGVGGNYVSIGNNTSMTANSWLMFENVDFANGGLKNLNIALAGDGTAQFRVSIDAPNDGTNATYTTTSRTNAFTLPSSLQTLTGVHDVYVTLISGTIELDYLQFDDKDFVADCNGVANGMAVLDNCDRCTGGTTGKTACTSVGEAEVDFCASNGVAESGNTGFKGASYLNTPNNLTGYITFNIDAVNAGNAIVSFRYANGGANDRAAKLTLNGVVLPDLSFPVTTAWTVWKTTEVQITLKAGVNTLTVASASSTDGLANFDQIGYVSPGLTKGSCLITGIVSGNTENSTVIYPNPSAASFNLNSKEYIQAITIVDLLGAEVYSKNNIPAGDEEIDLITQEGIYLIHIQYQSGFMEVKKLVKMK